MNKIFIHNVDCRKIILLRRARTLVDKSRTWLDVHQETIVACVMYGPLDKRAKKEIRTFGTTTKELLQLQDWLTEYNCSDVAMESTGVYWNPIWNILEGSFHLWLANPQRIKNLGQVQNCCEP